MNPVLPTAVVRWSFAVDAAEIAALLGRGGLIAFPTESSYGLGADPQSAAGVAAVYRLKGREADKPLPVVAAAVEQLLALGVAADSPGLAWARSRWPAALTVVLPLAAPVAASAGRREIAARIPAHPELRALLARLGHGLTATSANPSGSPPLVDPEEVASWLLGQPVEAAVIDGGRLPGGPPSTLVDWSPGGPRLLRAGRVALD